MYVFMNKGMNVVNVCMNEELTTVCVCVCVN